MIGNRIFEVKAAVIIAEFAGFFKKEANPGRPCKHMGCGYRVRGKTYYDTKARIATKDQKGTCIIPQYIKLNDKTVYTPTDKDVVLALRCQIAVVKQSAFHPYEIASATAVYHPDSGWDNNWYTIASTTLIPRLGTQGYQVPSTSEVENMDRVVDCLIKCLK